MAEKLNICQVCGARNSDDATRCASCGAKLRTPGVVDLMTDDNGEALDDFDWKWVWVALGLFVLAQGLTLVLLPRVIATYDPQGLPGVLITAAIWFLGAVAVGMATQTKPFLEPVVAATIVAIPTVVYLMSIADVYKMSLLAHVVGAVLGIMMCMLGSVLGNRLRSA